MINTSENEPHANKDHVAIAMGEHDAVQPRDGGNSPSPMLNALNVLNVCAYILNLVVVMAIGTGGVGGLPTNSELSAKYQTLVTPAGWAFSIWGFIYAFQGVFTIAQLLPRFRAVDMVQCGVGYWYIIACLFQVAWTLVFAYEVIPASLAFMVLIWISLVGLVISQYYSRAENTLLEFWLLKFPFALHCGWITAATALNVNVVTVSVHASASVQLTVGILSLAVLLGVAVFVVFVPVRPNYTIAAVLSWATGAIASELSNPSASLVELFTPMVISAVQGAAAASGIIIAILIFVRVGVSIRKWFVRLDERESEGSSGDNTVETT